MNEGEKERDIEGEKKIERERERKKADAREKFMRKREEIKRNRLTELCSVCSNFLLCSVMSSVG